MKYLLAAAALVIAAPAVAQTAPAPDHSAHAQHPAQGQQGGHDQHGQHQPGQQGQHQGHAMAMDCCADRNGNGQMDCCENMPAGRECCCEHGEGHGASHGQAGEPQNH